MVGCTSADKYRKFIEKDPGLERRFQVCVCVWGIVCVYEAQGGGHMRCCWLSAASCCTTAGNDVAGLSVGRMQLNSYAHALESAAPLFYVVFMYCCC